MSQNQKKTSGSFKEKIEMVDQFHQSFRIPRRDFPSIEPDAAIFELRHRLLEEENNEYLQACREVDLTAIADSIGDMLYVLLGTAVNHGLQNHLEAVFDEIHRSNMSKLDENGNPVVREDGKILKSPLYFRPDLRKFFDSK